MSASQIPYRTVEVSPLTKKQLKWSDYRKVPVALLDGEPVTDSTAIITRLAAEVAEERQQRQASHAQGSLSGWRKLIGGGSRREGKVRGWYGSTWFLPHLCAAVLGEHAEDGRA